jgi:endoglucanase
LFHKEVVDALIRQPHTTQTLPYTMHSTEEPVYASQFDLGRNGYAYFDLDTADYHLDMNGEFTAWNSGWIYRNDGVDIQACSDQPLSNGYHVGWTENGEWLQYTFENDSAAAFTMEFRSSSGGSGSQVRVEINGGDASGPVSLPGTGGWESWTTTEFEGVILPAGTVEMRIVFIKGGSNLNYIRFKNPVAVNETAFQFVSASSPEVDNEIYVSMNKEVTNTESLNSSDFILYIDGVESAIQKVELSDEDSRVLLVYPEEVLFHNQNIKITYNGTLIMHEDQELEPFTFKTVDNQLAVHHTLPGRIEVEEYYFNQGLELEECQDVGGGMNTGYANPGDYLDYVVYVEEAGLYSLGFRVATEKYNAELAILLDQGDGFTQINSMDFVRTGGWQKWETQTLDLQLAAGKYVLRLLVSGEEYNLNWMEFTSHVGTRQAEIDTRSTLFPNPASDLVHIRPAGFGEEEVQMEVYDSLGRIWAGHFINQTEYALNIEEYTPGLYYIRLFNKFEQQLLKLLVAQ